MRLTKSVNPNRGVALWVLGGTVMLLIQVLLGGITRLSGSGLSITEWDVFVRALPPLNEAQWMTEFGKYKLSPQYKLLNSDFTLRDFKFIFFWEWFHRTWAKLVGLVFVVGFVVLIAMRRMKAEMIPPLLILFLMGAMQATIGWIMVASGLTGDAIYVQPTKLALHFIFALGLISYAFWFSLQLLFPVKRLRRMRGLRRGAKIIVGIIFAQLLYGALMAGNKAAGVAPTWPSINGDWIPANLFKDKPVLANFVGNPVMIHFIHRGLAYIVLIGITYWTGRLFSSGQVRYERTKLIMPLGLVWLQVILGIVTVLVSPGIVANHWVFFDWVALFHQLNGMLLLLSMIYALYMLRPSATR